MTHTEKEKEADIGGMRPEVKECWQPPTSGIRDCPGRPEVDCAHHNCRTHTAREKPKPTAGI